MNEKYKSRKFIVTITSIVATTVLAYFGKVNADVALIYSTAIASYNIANAWKINKEA